MRRYALRGAVLAAAAIAALAGCSDDGGDDKASNKPVKPPAAEAEKGSVGEAAGEKEPSSPTLKIGETKVVDLDGSKARITVNGAEYIGAPAMMEKAKGQYVLLGLTIKNTGSKPFDFSPYGVMSWENTGTAAQDASTLGYEDGPDLATSYKPGQALTGKLLLDVGRKGGTVSYPGGDIMSEESAFSVALPK
ncbi:DUF4352 domain-containing protein [Streptomyces aureocirculatus]|uniref:DUF4352 domain-containing protein n=1 Tax=Streptomyces aureocirculatus TaxID=67275 RepID=UPI0004CA9C1C|nr:DUF4352 domain-containing protein [Streptomyces aureocirculatus]